MQRLSRQRRRIWVVVLAVLLLSFAVPYNVDWMSNRLRPRRAGAKLPNLPTNRFSRPPVMLGPGDKKFWSWRRPRSCRHPRRRARGTSVPPTAPTVEPGEELMPINLPPALQLANACAWDIVIAENNITSALPPPALLGTGKSCVCSRWAWGRCMRTIPGRPRTPTAPRPMLPGARCIRALPCLPFSPCPDAIFEPLAQPPNHARPGGQCPNRHERYANRRGCRLFPNAWKAAGGTGRRARCRGPPRRHLVQKTNGYCSQSTVPAVELRRVKAAQATTSSKRRKWPVSTGGWPAPKWPALCV